MKKKKRQIIKEVPKCPKCGTPLEFDIAVNRWQFMCECNLETHPPHDTNFMVKIKKHLREKQNKKEKSNA